MLLVDMSSSTSTCSDPWDEEPEMQITESDLWIIDYDCDLDGWVEESYPELFQELMVLPDEQPRPAVHLYMTTTGRYGDTPCYVRWSYFGEDYWFYDGSLGTPQWTVSWIQSNPDADCIEDSEFPITECFDTQAEVDSFFARLCSESHADLIYAMTSERRSDYYDVDIRGPHCYMQPLPTFFECLRSGYTPFDDMGRLSWEMTHPVSLQQIFLRPLVTFWVAVWRRLFTVYGEYDDHISIVQMIVSFSRTITFHRRLFSTYTCYPPCMVPPSTWG